MDIAAETVWELIERRAASSPTDRLAVDDQNREVTFEAFRCQALSVAAGLYNLGVRQGSVVSWQLPTWLESLILAGALSRLGAVQHPIIPMNRHREVSFMTRQIGTQLLIVPDVWRDYDFGRMATGIASANSALDALVLIDRVLPEGDPAILPVPQAPGGPDTPDEDPVRWVMFTSGTTADPKGARHTDRTLMTSSWNMGARMRVVSTDRIAIAFPFTHIGGLTLLFTSLMTGCSTILVEQFGDSGIETLSRHGVTLAGSGTPFNLAYLRAQGRIAPRRLFPMVRAFPGGGSSRPPDLHQRMKAAFGAGIRSGYGLTETGFLAMADMDDPDDALATTEGRSYPGSELRLVDPAGKTCGPGEEGEICAKGPMVMKGYVDATLDVAFDAEGYFHTGDLGIVDEQGYVRITGRLKEIIIRNGENISAREVEDLLYEHPAIEESAVVGLPDPYSGERCCAVVVLADGAPEPSLVDLRHYLASRGLSMYKIPEELRLVDALPKNASGKVTKHILVRQLADSTSTSH